MTEPVREQLQATLGGAYTLERELGGGGMSRVFLAEEHRLKRKVVVKVLSPELAQGLSVERFEREIQTAAALQQANIVPVLNAGDTNGLPFYTMPFVEGESLRARLGRGPLSISEVVGVMRDVARSLAYAHRQGVVHRDIKPDNVLISEGAAMVTDFGIAKAISAARTGTGGATLTQIGTSIGTPAYMAPEQAAGDPGLDHRADIYSLGATVYELLAGHPVFANRTAQRMLAAHMGEAPVPVSQVRTDLPPALAELVMQCLAKEPDARPQNASDIARALENITSGGSLPAMPGILLGGATMFRKALAIYAATFVAVTILAKAAIVGIGLPDWVFPGALIIMALGLPVILWTAYVHRVAQRAATATPTFTPGGSPATTHGTIATFALKAAPHVNWYRTARGGIYALGAFAIAIAAFMGMRALGIGPFGSLIARGELDANNKIVIADFEATNGDSALGRVVAEAVRAGLSDSRVFTIVPPSEIGTSLQAMKVPSSAMLLSALARQVALREGAKAVVDGTVTPVGGSYIVSARLITADSGRELMSDRATADHIINVADALSRKLRARAGESLRHVQGSHPLEHATTSSLEALRKYAEGSWANDIAAEPEKAVAPLREAVRIDSTFAEAWRKLAVALGNAGFAQASVDSAMNRAFALRDRLNDRDRDLILAGYYERTSAHWDRALAIAAYERMLARGDSTIPLGNLAVRLMERREYARAEAMLRRALEMHRGANRRGSLLAVLILQGKWSAADSVIADARSHGEEGPNLAFDRAGLAINRGRISESHAVVDSLRRAGPPGVALNATYATAYADLVEGRFAEGYALLRQAGVLDEQRGGGGRPVDAIMSLILFRSLAGLSTADQVRSLDSALLKTRLDSGPEADRPYFAYASAYAQAGRVDKARAMLRQYDAGVRDTGLRRVQRNWLRGTGSIVAKAEHRWADAVRAVRDADSLPDGPSSPDPSNAAAPIIAIWAEAGMADSAIAENERYLQTPFGGRTRDGPDVHLPAPVIAALARAYDARGNTARAVALNRDFVELWKDADAELQPQVQSARQRLNELEATDTRRSTPLGGAAPPR